MPNQNLSPGEVDPSWVALAQAPFVFRAEMGIEPPQLDLTPSIMIKPFSKDVRLTINYVDRVFDIDLIRKAPQGEAAEVRRIRYRPTALPTFDFLTESLSLETWKNLSWPIRREWAHLKQEFLHAACNKLCLIYGRPQSLFASFTLVPPEMFRLFEIVDWEYGIAESLNGERLFSIHAAPIEGAQHLGAPTEIQTLSGSRKKAAPSQELARMAIQAIYQSSIPKHVRNKEIISAVDRWCKTQGLSPPSETSIRRAAQRR